MRTDSTLMLTLHRYTPDHLFLSHPSLCAQQSCSADSPISLSDQAML